MSHGQNDFFPEEDVLGSSMFRTPNGPALTEPPDSACKELGLPLNPFRNFRKMFRCSTSSGLVEWKNLTSPRGWGSEKDSKTVEEA